MVDVEGADENVVDFGGDREDTGKEVQWVLEIGVERWV